MNNANAFPAMPRIGTRVEVVPAKHGRDYDSGMYYVIEHTGTRDVGLAKSQAADYATLYIDISRLDW